MYPRRAHWGPAHEGPAGPTRAPPTRARPASAHGPTRARPTRARPQGPMGGPYWLSWALVGRVLMDRALMGLLGHCDFFPGPLVQRNWCLILMSASICMHMYAYACICMHMHACGPVREQWAVPWGDHTVGGGGGAYGLWPLSIYKSIYDWGTRGRGIGVNPVRNPGAWGYLF